MTKDFKIEIRLTADEKEYLHRVAGGPRKVSEYVREVLFSDTVVFSLDLSEEDMSALQSAADNAGMVVSDWVIHCCNAACSVEPVLPRVETATEPSDVLAAPARKTMAHPGNCRCNMCRIGRGEIK